jgi:hypothetical protein
MSIYTYIYVYLRIYVYAYIRIYTHISRMLTKPEEDGEVAAW